VSRPYQELRPSQFVITFGPGSIVETASGPVVLKSMDTLFNAIGPSPQDFEIFDERLSRLELGGARIARVPTNAELQLPADNPIYPSAAFPSWALCAQHRPYQILYEAGAGCPECPPFLDGVGGRRRVKRRYVSWLPATTVTWTRSTGIG
jgi:hypothetical protein